MTNATDVRELPAPARAALVAIASRGEPLKRLRLERETDDRRQPAWWFGNELYKNADIAALIDAGILTLEKRSVGYVVRFSDDGIRAWARFTGNGEGEGEQIDYNWGGAFDDEA